MSVLVLAAPDDLTADLVVLALAERGTEVFRWDTADFPQRTQLTARLTQGGWRGSLATRERVLNLEDVTSVYYRRPRAFDLPSELTVAERRFAYEQAQQSIGGVLMSLDCRWVNSPASVAAAEFKPRQVVVAQRCGLSVPETLITNRAEDIGPFVGGGIVTKPMARPALDGDEFRLVYTHRLDGGDLADLRGIGATGHLFQEWVAKRWDLRVTAVGDQIFATAIHAQSDRSLVDWRSDYDSLNYQPVSLPSDVQAGVHAYLRTFGLIFGAFDFTVGKDGKYSFLECNPNGQWAFIEQATGQPISDAIAAELTRAPDCHGRHG